MSRPEQRSYATEVGPVTHTINGWIVKWEPDVHGFHRWFLYSPSQTEAIAVFNTLSEARRVLNQELIRK